MSYDFEFLPKAQIEYTKAFAWYNEQLDGLGDRFENAVEKKLITVNENPVIYSKKAGGFREVKIEGFPYLIVYKIYPEKNLIVIYSIFHTSRWPGKKYRK
jgi:mRNA-degrading endonuclease RelE of RelBE toxin-antitoxin system